MHHHHHHRHQICTQLLCLLRKHHNHLVTWWRRDTKAVYNFRALVYVRYPHTKRKTGNWKKGKQMKFRRHQLLWFERSTRRHGSEDCRNQLYNASTIYLRHVIPPGTPEWRPLLSQIARNPGKAEPGGMGVAVYWLIRHWVDKREGLKNRSAPPMMGMATPLFTGFTYPGW